MKTFTKAGCALLVLACAMLAPQAAAQSPLPGQVGAPFMYYYDGTLIPNVDPTCVLTLSPYGLGIPLLTPAQGSLRNTCGSMLRGRLEHTATTLGNGRVLIAGGDADVLPAAGNTLNCVPGAVYVYLGLGTCPAPPTTIIADAELYDPTVSVFLPAGAMGHARTQHLAVRLNDGRVLIVGGVGLGAADPGATAELYDPGSGQFYATGAPAQARSIGATATVLPSGRVLIAGGAHCTAYYTFNYNCASPTASAELYDPATGRFTPTGSLGTARMRHAAVLLASGKVLILGGLATNDWNYPLASAEIYDPATGKFTATGSLPQAVATPAAARLPDGHVLAVDTGAAALYNPASGQFSGIAGPGLSIGDGPDAALLLPDGKVFLKAGWCNRPQLFDPASKTFSVAGTNLPVGNPNTGCFSAAAAVLQTGEPLTTGGFSFNDNGPNGVFYEFYKQAQLFHP